MHRWRRATSTVSWQSWTWHCSDSMLEILLVSLAYVWVRHQESRRYWRVCSVSVLGVHTVSLNTSPKYIWKISGQLFLIQSWLVITKHHISCTDAKLIWLRALHEESGNEFVLDGQYQGRFDVVKDIFDLFQMSCAVAQQFQCKSCGVVDDKKSMGVHYHELWCVCVWI